ncbi:MAG: hypothetical protein ABI775_13940 [Pseudonocardiales bacterium]
MRFAISFRETGAHADTLLVMQAAYLVVLVVTLLGLAAFAGYVLTTMFAARG